MKTVLTLLDEYYASPREIAKYLGYLMILTGIAFGFATMGLWFLLVIIVAIVMYLNFTT